MDVDVLAKCNPCLSNPCLNHGICHNDPTDIYRCSCPPGFKVKAASRHTKKMYFNDHKLIEKILLYYNECPLCTLSQGKNCETGLNACMSNPCANGSTCRVSAENEGEYRWGTASFRIRTTKTWKLKLSRTRDECVFVTTVARVHWALRARLAKATVTTAKTTTARMEPPALMESTTTLVFVPPTTQVSAYVCFVLMRDKFYQNIKFCFLKTTYHVKSTFLAVEHVLLCIWSFWYRKV